MGQSYVFYVLREKCYLTDRNVGAGDHGGQEAVCNMTDNFFIYDNNLKVMAASNHVIMDNTNTTDIVHIRNYSSFEKSLPTSKSQNSSFLKLCFILGQKLFSIILAYRV